VKKVLVLEGSPRAGNTALVADWVISGLGRGWRTTRVRVADQRIAGCRECFACGKVNARAGCAQRDDMTGLYGLITAADLVVFTTPVFCWGMTGPLKNLVDRCFALLNGKNLLKGSRWALVVTAGGDAFDGADLIVEQFRRLAEFAGARVVGQHVVAPCPDRRRFNRDKPLAAAARSFGRKLDRSVKAGRDKR